MELSINNIGKPMYRRLLVKLLVIAAVVFVLDFAIGNVLKIFYFKQNSGLDYRTTYAIEQASDDLLIFGSSTANHDYIPGIFKDRFGISSSTVGRDGMPIFYNYALLKAILKRHKPKVIILDFEKQEFKKSQDSYDRLSCLLPYYRSHPEIASVVDLKSSFEKYKLFSSIYPYNSMFFTICAGNSEYNKERQNEVDGYVPLKKMWSMPIEPDTSFIHDEVDSNKVRFFRAFIEDCLRSNIELYIVSSPLFIRTGYVNDAVVLGKNIAAKYKIKFLDYSQDTDIVNQPALFADIEHLNDRGAAIYTNKIADTILAREKSNPDSR